MERGKWIIFLFRFVSIVFTVIFMLTLGSIIYTVSHQNEIIENVISELNKNEFVSFNYSKVDFDFTKNFPFGSINFKNFSATINHTRHDTLVTAQKLLISLNIVKLFNNSIVFNRIYLTHGIINFDAIKTLYTNVTNDNNTTSLKYYISNFNIYESEINFTTSNYSSKKSIYIEKLKFDINAANKIFIRTQANAILQHGFTKNLLNKKFSLQFNGRITDSSIIINNSSIEHRGIKFAFEGIYNKTNTTLLSHFRTNALNINTIKEYIPNNFNVKSGKIFAHGNFSINTDNNKFSFIKVYFNAKNIKANYKEKDVEIEQTDGCILFKNNLSKITGQINYNNALIFNFLNNGKLLIKKRNRLILYTEGNSSFSNIKHPNFKQFKGLKSDFEYKILATNASDSLDKLQIVKLEVNGNLFAEGIKDMDRIKSIEGRFNIANNAIIKLNGTFDTSSIDISIKVNDILKKLHAEKSLKPNIKINANYLDLNYILASLNQSDISDSEDSLNYFISFTINKLKYLNSSFSKVNGLLTAYNKDNYAVSFDGYGYSGYINGTTNSNRDINSLNLSLSTINISQFFSDFNNFDQSIVTSDRIEGLLSGNVNMLYQLDSIKNINWNTVNGDASLLINKGKIKGADKIGKLAKWIKAETLKEISFKSLKNNIYFKNGIIEIPQMDVLSNAIAFNVSGKHTLANQYEYYLRINVSDLVSRKYLTFRADTTFPKSSKGFVNLYLKLYGKDTSYNVSVNRNYKSFINTTNENADTLRIKNIIRNDIKSVFNNNSDKNKPKADTAKAFKIEWDEYDSTKIK